MNEYLSLHIHWLSQALCEQRFRHTNTSCLGLQLLLLFLLMSLLLLLLLLSKHDVLCFLLLVFHTSVGRSTITLIQI